MDAKWEDSNDSSEGKKSWKARLTELEAKMAAMSATSEASGSSRKKVTPSYYAEEDDHMLYGMANSISSMVDAFAMTRSKTTVAQDIPHGASLALD